MLALGQDKLAQRNLIEKRRRTLRQELDALIGHHLAKVGQWATLTPNGDTASLALRIPGCVPIWASFVRLTTWFWESRDPPYHGAARETGECWRVGYPAEAYESLAEAVAAARAEWLKNKGKSNG